MEFLPSEIARLVLGYLEDEKCEPAYDTFLTTSPNLKECLIMRNMGKKFHTTVIGLSLKEMLHEYSMIYYSVQERLKKLDPDTADSLRSSGSLLDKLTFLLNANGTGQTMLFSITVPHGKSPSTPAVAHVRKRFKSSSLERIKDKFKKARHRSESELVSNDVPEPSLHSTEVDTTPLYSLPGNNTCNQSENSQDYNPDDKISRTPKRKSTSVRKSRANSSLSGTVEDNLDFSVLTKVFLDNHELHEKLAENINKVILTPEVPAQPPVEQAITNKPESTAVYSASFNNELDHMIKKVVEQTESDPLFENIIFEALDPSVEETSDDCEERRISNTSTPRKYEGSNSSDQDSRTVVKTKQKTSDFPSKKIDDQNADAIKSIIAVNNQQKELQENVSKTEETVQAKNPPEVVSVPETITVPETVTVPETTVKMPEIRPPPPLKRLSQPAQNIVVFSQSQPMPPTYLLTTTPTYPMHNQVLILDNKCPTPSPFIIQPPPPLHLTERDILSMPTVIMYDNVQPTKIQQPLTVQKILPKGSQEDKSKNSTQLSITLYAADDKSPKETKMDIQPMGNNVQVTISPVKPGKSVPMILDSVTKEGEDMTKNTTEKLCTPATELQPRQSTSTPRSAKSHIRALDFSTPSKDEPTKRHTSPKNAKRSLTLSQKTPRSNLLSNVPIATRTPLVKLCGEWDNVHGTGLILGKNEDKDKKNKSWDEDLRALCVGGKEQVKASPKKKKQKKKPKRKSLNKTDEAVKEIEKALVEEETTKKKPKKKEVKKVVKKEDKEVEVKVLEIEKMQEVKIILEPVKIVEKVETPPVVRNMNPKKRKKCNLNNPPLPAMQNDQNSCKIETENSTKITHDENDIEKPKPEVPAIVPEISTQKELNLNVSQSKITPTNQQIVTEQAVSFKTNLTPIFETPIKFDSFGNPITPKIFTPFMTTDTPFSKLLNENIGSVDLTSIATPNFPVTPNFCLNLTPGSQLGEEPYNRPTDYSTSSSYYQPSDSDQNQVDMALIEESKNMDKQKRSEKPDTLPEPEVDRKKFTADYVLNEISLETPIKPNHPSDTEVIETLFNSSSSTNNSSDSSFSCSSCSSSSDDSSSKSENTNETVIHVPQEEPKRYSLRLRKTPCETVTPVKISLQKRRVVKAKRDEPEIMTDKNTIPLITKLENINLPSTSGCRVARPKSKSKVTSGLFESLEEKRVRVMKAMKDDKNPTKKPSKKPPKKPAKKSVAKNKKADTKEIDDKDSKMDTSIENMNETKLKSKTPRKCESIESVAIRLKELNKSILESETKQECEEKSDASGSKDEEIPPLHLSSDEDTVSNKQSEVLEENERKKLEELKERGIHLIPKNTKPLQKVEIKNIVVLGNDDKIDFSKVGSSDCVKTDIISKPVKNVPEKTIDIPDQKKLDYQSMDYQFSLEDDVLIPAEANFEQAVFTEDSTNFCRFVHDETVPSKRTFENEFIEISKKTISAEVFVSELDVCMKRTMSFTPYVELFTYFPPRRRIAPIKIENLKLIQANRQAKIAERQNTVEAQKVKSAEKKDKNVKKGMQKLSLEQYRRRQSIEGKNKDVDSVENDEEISNKKRKLSSDVADAGRTNPEKRSKPADQRALLKDVDLDLFLSKVHGPSNE